MTENLTVPNHQIAEQKANTLYQRISEIKITNEETLTLAGDLVKEVKRIAKSIEEEFDPAISQAYKSHKSMIALRDKVLEKFEEAAALAKEKIKHYLIDEEAKDRVVELPEGITAAETWKGKVVDETLIPREYLIPDLKKLSEHTKIYKETTKIPGWKVSLEKTLSVRA
jgi:hypothetical protein